MREKLFYSLCILGVLAFLSLRYDFKATSVFQQKWLRLRNRQQDSQTVSFQGPDALDGVTVTMPDSQEHRQVRIKRICENYHEWLSKPKHRGQKSNFYPNTLRRRHCSTVDCPLLVDLQRNFLFCSVPKVASTSMKAFFLDLQASSTGRRSTSQSSSNSSAQRDVHEAANESVNRVSPYFYSLAKLRTFYRAMFVRHPFERLVSIYEDKINKEPSENKFFYDKYFRSFMKRREIAGQLSFVDFVDYLVETPRFEYDEHWKPYFERCEPCHVEYDFVGKLETPNDFHAMLHHSGDERSFDASNFSIPHLHGRDAGERSRFPEEYFLQLERNQIMALYRIYRFDFELFGYNILEYIDAMDNFIS